MKRPPQNGAEQVDSRLQLAGGQLLREQATQPDKGQPRWPLEAPRQLQLEARSAQYSSKAWKRASYPPLGLTQSKFVIIEH